MDMLLELLTNPKPITKRDGKTQSFQFEKLERSIASAFRTQGKNEEALIRPIVEEALQEFGKAYAASNTPSTQQLREAVLIIFDKHNHPTIKDAYQNNQKIPRTTPTPTPATSVANPVAQPTTPSASVPPSPSSSFAMSSAPLPPSPSIPVAGENYVARRRRLNEERKAVTHKFQVGAYEGYLIVGLYDDGQPGEIFLRMNKEGSMLSGMMDSFATAISIGLQYGVPLKVLVKKFAGVHFEPNGPTQNPNIPHARSIMDYIFRWLAVKFLTPEERQTVLGLHDDQGMEVMEVSNVDGARQSRLLDGGNA